MSQTSRPLAIWLAFGALAAGPVAAAPVSDGASTNLQGDWRAVDGSDVVRVAPCGGALCATVIEERAKSGEASSLGKVVIRDLTMDGARGWRGRYVGDGQNFAATVRPQSGGAVEFKVCPAPMICDTARYVRTSSR